MTDSPKQCRMGQLVYSMGERGPEVIQGKCAGSVPGQAACSKGLREAVVEDGRR